MDSDKEVVNKELSLSLYLHEIVGVARLEGHITGHAWGGLVFKAHRLLYHSTLGLRVIKKKRSMPGVRGSGFKGWSLEISSSDRVTLGASLNIYLDVDGR